MVIADAKIRRGPTDVYLSDRRRPGYDVCILNGAATRHLGEFPVATLWEMHGSSHSMASASHRTSMAGDMVASSDYAHPAAGARRADWVPLSRRILWARKRTSIVILSAPLLALVSFALIVSGQPAGAARTTPSQTIRSAQYSVGLTRCTFVDRTRSVLNYETVPPTTLSRARTLVTEIRYPTRAVVGVGSASARAQPARLRDGFPMIVFAHGYDVAPDTYSRLLDAWVKAGYVVAAPLFPDENAAEVAAQHGANTESDLVNEPADLAFVTRQVIAASLVRSSTCPIVHGLIRAAQIVLAGHSDGATVGGMLSFAHGLDPQGESYQALRAGLHYRAAIIMSGQEDEVDPYRSMAPNPALLVIQSAADQCNLPSNSLKLYSDIHEENKWFLELLTAHHLPPFDGVDVPAFNVVVKTTVRFLAVTLRASTRGVGLSADGNESPLIARMFHGGNGPAIPVAPNHFVQCGPN